MWWEYYRLCTLSDEELIEDKNALGGLVYVGVVEETKRSLVHRYQFPVQDHSIDRALEAPEVRLDLRRVLPVLEALALRALIALDL